MDNLKVKEMDNFSTGKTVKCYCNKCAKKINHVVIKSIKEEFEEITSDYGFDGFSDYQILKCNGCNDYSFREYKYFSEYRDYDTDGIREILYPIPTENNRNLIDFNNLPFNLELIYEESIKCYNSKNVILCAVGIRAILEGLCIDRKIKKGIVKRYNQDGTYKEVSSKNLDGKINGLHEQGIITKAHADALHELRFLGNNAIHEFECPNIKDLNTAFDIIEHILVGIYDLPQKAERLEKKRKK